MTYKENITAILECYFTGFKKEIIDSACNRILEQEPKTGHWIMLEDGLYRPICDKCGAHPWKGYIPTVEEATEVFKYCPNCGAKMVDPKESEDNEET